MLVGVDVGVLVGVDVGVFVGVGVALISSIIMIVAEPTTAPSLIVTVIGSAILKPSGTSVSDRVYVPSGRFLMTVSTSFLVLKLTELPLTLSPSAAAVP